jgi:serine/threonine-protein kinase ATR
MPRSVSSDDELNIVLLRLVQYLGHPNPIIYGLAYYEVRRTFGNSSLY